MLLVQEYLRSGKTLDDLKTEHGVKYFVQNGKISLSYDQIEAKESDPLSQQCRGLILREKTFDVVALPMFRFFNLDQGTAAPIDYSTAVFEEKLDGTLIILYYDDVAERWFVATRSRPQADVFVDDSNQTFTDLVNIALQKITDNKISDVNELMNRRKLLQNKTFCFELCSPANRIVCDYPDFSLTLLAVRNNVTYKEENPEQYSKLLKIPTVKTHSFSDMKELIEVIQSWDPKEHEGIVVKDANFNRIKVKSPAYVAYNHLRDSLSTSFRGCVEIILLGKDDDVIAMLPEFIGNRIKRIKPLIQTILSTTQKDFDELSQIEDMKEFALEAQKRMWPACLFALKRNKTPNILTFARGNEKCQGKIPTTAIDSLLGMCEKLDPELRG